MKKLTLLLLAIVPLFLTAKLIQNSGPYFEYEDVYFDPHKKVLVLPHEAASSSYSLWKPFSCPLKKSASLSNKIEHWEGTTILFIDSCTGFLTHYFHFLEHLIGLWQCGGCENAHDVTRIVFCSQEAGKKRFDWKGVNKINEKIIKALFPRANVYRLAQIESRVKNSIHCDKMLVSSRIVAYYDPACSHMNKMLGASWQDIHPLALETLRQKVCSSLNVTPLPPSDKPRITYLTRHPPRALTPKLEKALIETIQKETGLSVQKVDFSTISFDKQLQIIANSDVLISVHGNGLSHILFLPETATAIELFPPKSFTWDYALLAKIKGIDYYGYNTEGWITSEANPTDDTCPPHGNLNMPVDSLDIATIIEVIEAKKQSLR